MQTQGQRRRILSEIPQADREAIVQKAFYDGVAYDAIAKRFNTTRGVVSSLVFEHRKAAGDHATRPVTIRRFSWQDQEDNGA